MMRFYILWQVKLNKPSLGITKERHFGPNNPYKSNTLDEKNRQILVKKRVVFTDWSRLYCVVEIKKGQINMPKKSSKNRTALIVGSSGLVGGLVLKLLLLDDRWDQVISITRTALSIKADKLKSYVTDLDEISSLNMEDIDDVFCCLGTTIRKAGSRKSFRQVDHDYVISLAKKAYDCGATSFSLISAIGASIQSAVYYSKVKGEVERAVRGVGFKSVHIYRPSLLLGKRSEFRPLEELGQQTAPLLNMFMMGRMSDYKAIEAKVLANAMIEAPHNGLCGEHIHRYDDIVELAQTA
jgi:uncharacterized protein YbjT (DUF2867 family)